MNTPQSTQTLLDTTIQALTNGEHATAAGPALVDDWLNELAHYDGLGTVREALGSLQKSLLNDADPVQIRLLLTELAEYTQAFARQEETSNAASLQQLADTLQRLLIDAEEIGHS
ncbi:hypothetical protein [Fibrella arboris]|uniref:hypothetical protein n=1 Tax=Fibrella arboris TaxID=3242486 RepID=UPI0035223212